MRIVKLCALLGLLALTLPSCYGRPRLQSRLDHHVAGLAPRLVAVAYADLATGHRALVNADAVVHAASTMKVPVMIELYRRADAGTLDLDAMIPVRNAFKSIVDGSPYTLSPADDSDLELYDHVGKDMTIRELLQRMIRRSSNLATNLLIEIVDPARIRATMASLGATRMKVLRGVEDIKAYRQGLSNTATAHDLMVLLAAIAQNRAASEQACREMVEILLSQEFNDMIPAGLPKGTRVAHKTGRITRIHHDAAIVYPEHGNPYVLVVLTQGYDNAKESARVVAEVTALVHGAK